MEAPLNRVVRDFPYPIAYPYSLIFDDSQTPSLRRWALCFTEYQLLRVVCLPLVCQYLREAVDESARDSIASLNRAVAAIRSPFFSDWITLVHTLRQISFFLEKQDTAPWTIADSGLDYSRRTLWELIGTKYFPPCYVPFVDLDRHFQAFLRVPRREHWTRETTRRRYVTGFLLVGLAGFGKTAFLARQVEQLLGTTSQPTDRENPHLVFFLRGNGVVLRAEGMSLFRDVAEKLGVAVVGAVTKSRSGGGFSSFRELPAATRELLTNLGLLLRASGRTGDAESAYRRSVEIREVLWRADPDNVEIKAGYAGSLCLVGRFEEAERLIGELLALVPDHPYAMQVKGFLASRGSS
jgi:hypothetical protein